MGKRTLIKYRKDIILVNQIAWASSSKNLYHVILIERADRRNHITRHCLFMYITVTTSKSFQKQVHDRS